jgi:UDP-glucose:(heptosyl)LPS alpha-1,3-glucosyltransferase
MIRVGFVIDRWDPRRGGAERALAALVGRLVAAGDEALVYCLSAEPDAPGTVRRLPRPRRLRGSLEAVFADRAREAARADRCDVTVAVRHTDGVDIYWPHAGLHAATLAAGEASRGAAFGALSRAAHALSPKHQAFLRLEADLLTGGGARVVWCVSRLVRDEIAAACPAAASRLVLRPNGVDTARFHPGLRRERRAAFLARHGLDPASPVLLFCGGNWRLKGWQILREALADVPPPWTLVAAGAGETRVRPPELSAHAASGVDHAARVVLLPPQDAADLFGAADLLVQPTFRDPCSLATLEALAAGVPVLTTTANGAADAITAPGAGAVVPWGDARAFAAELRRWLPYLTVESLRSGEFAFEARRAAERRPAGAWLDTLREDLLRTAAGNPPGAGPTS